MCHLISIGFVPPCRLSSDRDQVAPSPSGRLDASVRRPLLLIFSRLGWHAVALVCARGEGPEGCEAQGSTAKMSTRPSISPAATRYRSKSAVMQEICWPVPNLRLHLG